MIIVFDVGLKGWSKFPNVLYIRNRFLNYCNFLITIQFSQPKTKALRTLLSSNVLSEDEVILNFINDLVNTVNDFIIFVTSDSDFAYKVKSRVSKVFVYNPRLHVLKGYEDPYFKGLETLTMVKSIRKIKQINDEVAKKYAFKIFKRTHGVVRIDIKELNIIRVKVLIDRFIESVKRSVKTVWYLNKFSNVNPILEIERIEKIIQENSLYRIYARYLTFAISNKVYTYDFLRKGTVIAKPINYKVKEFEVKGFEKPYKLVKTIWKKMKVNEKISEIVKTCVHIP